MSTLLVLCLIAGAYAQTFCPEFMKEQGACTCENYYDGAIVKCNGPEGPSIVEKLKAAQSEVRELALENANIIEVNRKCVFRV